MKGNATQRLLGTIFQICELLQSTDHDHYLIQISITLGMMVAVQHDQCQVSLNLGYLFLKCYTELSNS